MSGPQILTTILVLVFLLFLAWYDGWGRSSLTQADVDGYFAQLSRGGEEGGAEEDMRDVIRQFATTDDGNEFFMLNLNTYAGGSDSAANEDYAEYSSAVIPMLLSRASHPVYAGSGLQSLMNPRYEGGWEEVILVRYRSRRDFISMVTSQAYQKIISTRAAGVKYAEVFPTQSTINLITPRLFVALILGGIGVFLHMCLKGRPRYERNG